MRDLLTVVAALVIALLTAAVAVPPMVDWQAHRDLVERALAQALDAPVRTEGDIEVRLLPSPRVKLDRVRIGQGGEDGARAAAPFTASYVRAELALTPLLSGVVRLEETRIGRAEIRLAAAGNEWRLPRSFAEEMRRRGNWAVVGLSVSQLLLTGTDPTTGRTEQVLAENVRAQAQGLAGPWRIEGTSRQIPFQIAAGELGTDNAAALKLAAGGGREPRLELDGRLQLRPEGEALTPILTGSAKLTFGIPLQAGSAAAPIPVVATAGIKLSGRNAELDPVSVDAGEGPTSLRLSGTGRLTLDDPGLSLDLSGRRFDADGFLAAATPKDGTPASPRLRLPKTGLPIDLSLKLDTLALAGEEWTGLAADATLAHERVALRRLDLAGPGDTTLRASGELGGGFAAGGSGQIAIKSRSPGQLADLLQRAGLGPELGSLLDGNGLSLSADVVAAEPLISLRNLNLAFAGGTMTGALRYTVPEGGSRGRFDAQLALQGFDLRRAPPPAGLFSAARNTDLGLILDARNVSYGGAAGTGRIAARLSSEGSALRVDRLEIANLAGANGSVSGRIEPDGSGRIEGRLVAQRAAPLLDLAGQAWIGGLAGLIPQGLRDSAVDLALSAERADEAGKGLGLRTRLSGTVAGAPFEAETVSAGGELTRLQARLSTDRFGKWVGAADPALGRPARLSISGTPLASGHLGLMVEGDLAGVRLRTTRPVGVAMGEAALVSGAVEIETGDLTPLAVAIGEGRLATAPVPATLAATLGRDGAALQVGLKGRVGGAAVTADLRCGAEGHLGGTVQLDRLAVPWLASALALNLKPGDTAAFWPAARFGPAPTGRFQGEVAVKAGELELSSGLKGANAGFTLASTPDGLVFRDLSFDLAGGHVSGDATLARQGGLASLVGGGAVRDLDIGALAPGGPFAGRLSAELRFGGSGESVAGIVANLGGAGSLTLTQLKAAEADPDALRRTVTRLLRTDDPLASPKVKAAAAEELDRADLKLASLSGPATLVAGAVRVAPLRGETEAASWTGSVSLDLRSLSLDIRGVLQARAAPPTWSGDPPSLLLGWQGPVAHPARTLDVAPLVSGLAAVVLARELDRIDTFEADLNERQRRNGQREMERDRRAAQEAAKQEAAKEAARQEAARQEAARQEAARQEAARQAAIRAREAAERAQAERARAGQGAPASDQAPSSPANPVDAAPPQRPAPGG